MIALHCGQQNARHFQLVELGAVPVSGLMRMVVIALVQCGQLLMVGPRVNGWGLASPSCHAGARPPTSTRH